MSRGWRRPAPGLLPAWPAPARVGGARDRRGARGGGLAGWVLVGRRSAVRAPKVYKTLRLTKFLAKGAPKGASAERERLGKGARERKVKGFRCDEIDG